VESTLTAAPAVEVVVGKDFQPLAAITEFGSTMSW